MASFSPSLVLFLCVIFLAPRDDVRFGTCSLKITTARGSKVTIEVLTARNDRERARGLMYRKKLDADSGMLFIFPGEEYLSFWMKNTHIPLSIAYIDSRGVITEILDMRPLDEQVLYPSRRPSRYALEMNRGWFIRKGIVPGCVVDLHGCVGK